MLSKLLKKGIFFKDASFYVSATLFGRILSFLAIPFFTRMLKPYEYGYFSIYMTTVTFLFVFGGINIRGSLIRYYHERTNNFGEFLFSSIVFLFIWNFIILFLGVSFKNQFAKFLNIPVSLVPYIFIALFFTVFVEVYLAFLNAQEKSRQYAFFMYVQNILFIGLSVIGVLIISHDRYWGRVYAYIITMGILGFYVMLKLFNASVPKVSVKHIKYLLLFGVPLIFHSVSGYILSFFDRIIINQTVGSKEAGLYSFAYNISMIMNIFIMGFNKAWIPFFYKSLEDKNIDKIRRQSHVYSLTISVILLGVGLFSVDIAKLMASHLYFDSIKMIPVMVIGIGFVFLYTLYANISFYRKKTFYISINTFIAGTVNIILNYSLIPVMGYKVAAYTTVVSYVLLFILHYFTAEKVLKEHIFELSKVLIPILIAIILVSIILWISYNIKYGLIIKMALYLIILVIGYLYENSYNR